jgi:multiple sugar transport system permease protein
MAATTDTRSSPGGGPSSGTRRRGLLPRAGRDRPAASSTLWARLRRLGLPYLFLLPALLCELLVHLIPMIVGVVMSFKELTEFYIRNWTNAPAAGLGNYRIVVNFSGAIGHELLDSFFTTCVYTACVVFFSWLLGTFGALLTQDAFRGRGLLRTVFLIPYALPAYAAVITWNFMLQRDSGLINQVIVSELHLDAHRPFWLLGGNSLIAIIVVAVWRTWPFAFLVVTAGLQNIPRDLYEAAAIDGAGMWQRVRRVTLPSLRSVNQVLILVLFLWNFNDFNTPYVLFGASPPQQADLISVHIYQNSFVSWNFGSGSAMSVLLLLFLLVVTVVYLILTRQRQSDV